MANIRTIGFIIPSLGSGGAERVVALLAQALSCDFAVHVLVQKDASQHFPVTGAQVHPIDFTREGILAAVVRLKLDLILDHYHWDQAHVRMMAGLAGDGLPVVLTEHNAFHYPLFQWARNGQVDYEAWFEDRHDLYRRFAAVTVLNGAAFRRFGRHLDNLRLIPNPATPVQSRGFDPDARRVLTVSHFQKRAKRLDLLYHAHARLLTQVPDAALTVLGDYDFLLDRQFRLGAGLGEAVIETPGRTALVDGHFARSSVFALSSEIEGQPMVLLEAARHGMPQVAFDLPGLSDQLVDGETGLLVPFGDTEAFGDALAGLLTDPARLRRMGAASRDLVERDFALHRIVALWRGLIAEIAETGRVTMPEAPPPLGKAGTRADARWVAHWRKVATEGDATIPPKVSFLVPVFGTEALLGRCLRSIQAQSLGDFECIVVDDASPGDVQGTLRAAVGDDRRFRVIEHSRNRGLYQARSTAAAAARGLYFAHVDSDDYIHPEFAEILFNEAMTTGAEIVECLAVELREDGRPIRFNQVRDPGPVEGRQAAQAFFANHLRNVVWNKLYSRDLWMRVPGHMEIDKGLTICEDLLRNAFLFPECRLYSSVPDCLYYYCRRPTSVVKGGDLRRLMGKLSDIQLAYGQAKARQSAPDQAANWQRLEARRIEDVQWYVQEYLSRHDMAQVQAELRALEGEADPGLAILLQLVQARSTLKAENARLTQAWRQEQSRADKAEQRLAEMRKLMER